MPGVLQVVLPDGSTVTARRVIVNGAVLYPPPADTNLVQWPLGSDIVDVGEAELLINAAGWGTTTQAPPTTSTTSEGPPTTSTTEPPILTTTTEGPPPPTTTEEPPITTSTTTEEPPPTTTHAPEWWCYILEYWTVGTSCTGPAAGTVYVCVQNNGEGDIHDCFSPLYDPFGIWVAANAKQTCSCVEITYLAAGPYNTEGSCYDVCHPPTTTLAPTWWCYIVDYWNENAGCIGLNDGEMYICVLGEEANLDECYSAGYDPYGVWAAVHAFEPVASVLVIYKFGPYATEGECWDVCHPPTTTEPPPSTTTMGGWNPQKYYCVYREIYESTDITCVGLIATVYECIDGIELNYGGVGICYNLAPGLNPDYFILEVLGEYDTLEECFEFCLPP